METKTTSVAVRSELQVKLAAVNEQLKSIKAESEAPYRTNGEFRFNPAYTANAPIFIFKCKDLGLLISILSYLAAQSRNYTIAAQEILNLKTYPQFSWLGFTFDAWEHDIKIRVNQLTYEERIVNLKKAKTVLEGFMTEDDRLAIALKSLESLGI